MLTSRTPPGSRPITVADLSGDISQYTDAVRQAIADAGHRITPASTLTKDPSRRVGLLAWSWAVRDGDEVIVSGWQCTRARADRAGAAALMAERDLRKEAR